MNQTWRGFEDIISSSYITVVLELIKDIFCSFSEVKYKIQFGVPRTSQVYYQVNDLSLDLMRSLSVRREYVLRAMVCGESETEREVERERD